MRKLTRDLERLGAQVWLDEKRLTAGDSLLQGIRTGIDRSDHVVVVLSAASLSSEWVQREIDVASSIELSTGTTKVIPALRDSVTLPAMLEGKVYADFRGRGRYQAGLAALRRALRLDRQDVAVMVGVLLDYSGLEPVAQHLSENRYMKSAVMPATRIDIEIISGYLAYLRGDEQSSRGKFTVFPPQKVLDLDPDLPVFIRDGVVVAFGFVWDTKFPRVRPRSTYTPHQRHVLYVLGRADQVRRVLEELRSLDELPGGANHDLEDALKWWTNPEYISVASVDVVGSQ